MSAPLLVNQRTAPEVFGWTGERYIAFLRRKGVRHARDGRLFVARVDDVLAALQLSDTPVQAAPAWSREDVVAELKAGGRR